MSNNNESIKASRVAAVSTKVLTDSKNKIKAIAEKFSLYGKITPKGEETLETRLQARITQKQLLEQANLEQIIKLSYDLCHDEPTRDPDPDWLIRFLDMAEQIHNPSMQKLWARILKQELIQAGSVSLRTLQILQTMTHREAMVFQKTLALTCCIGNDKNKKLLTSIKQRKGSFSLQRTHQSHIDYSQYQLPYSSILILTELGLILSTELETNAISPTEKLKFSYHQLAYDLYPIRKGCSLTYYRLSPIGQELAHLIGSQPNDTYQEELYEVLLKYFTISSKEK